MTPATASNAELLPDRDDRPVLAAASMPTAIIWVMPASGSSLGRAALPP